MTPTLAAAYFSLCISALEMVWQSHTHPLIGRNRNTSTPGGELQTKTFTTAGITESNGSFDKTLPYVVNNTATKDHLTKLQTPSSMGTLLLSKATHLPTKLNDTLSMQKKSSTLSKMNPTYITTTKTNYMTLEMKETLGKRSESTVKVFSHTRPSGNNSFRRKPTYSIVPFPTTEGKLHLSTIGSIGDTQQTIFSISSKTRARLLSTSPTSQYKLMLLSTIITSLGGKISTTRTSTSTAFHSRQSNKAMPTGRGAISHRTAFYGPSNKSTTSSTVSHSRGEHIKSEIQTSTSIYTTLSGTAATTGNASTKDKPSLSMSSQEPTSLSTITRLFVKNTKSLPTFSGLSNTKSHRVTTSYPAPSPIATTRAPTTMQHTSKPSAIKHTTRISAQYNGYWTLPPTKTVPKVQQSNPVAASIESTSTATGNLERTHFSTEMPSTNKFYTTLSTKIPSNTGTSFSLATSSMLQNRNTIPTRPTSLSTQGAGLKSLSTSSTETTSKKQITPVTTSRSASTATRSKYHDKPTKLLAKQSTMKAGTAKQSVSPMSVRQTPENEYTTHHELITMKPGKDATAKNSTQTSEVTPLLSTARLTYETSWHTNNTPREKLISSFSTFPNTAVNQGLSTRGSIASGKQTNLLTSSHFPPVTFASSPYVSKFSSIIVTSLRSKLTTVQNVTLTRSRTVMSTESAPTEGNNAKTKTTFPTSIFQWTGYSAISNTETKHTGTDITSTYRYRDASPKATTTPKSFIKSKTTLTTSSNNSTILTPTTTSSSNTHTSPQIPTLSTPNIIMQSDIQTKETTKHITTETPTMTRKHITTKTPTMTRQHITTETATVTTKHVTMETPTVTAEHITTKIPTVTTKNTTADTPTMTRKRITTETSTTTVALSSRKTTEEATLPVSSSKIQHKTTIMSTLLSTKGTGSTIQHKTTTLLALLSTKGTNVPRQSTFASRRTKSKSTHVSISPSESAAAQHTSHNTPTKTVSRSTEYIWLTSERPSGVSTTYSSVVTPTSGIQKTTQSNKNGDGLTPVGKFGVAIGTIVIVTVCIIIVVMCVRMKLGRTNTPLAVQYSMTSAHRVPYADLGRGNEKDWSVI